MQLVDSDYCEPILTSGISERHGHPATGYTTVHIDKATNDEFEKLVAACQPPFQKGFKEKSCKRAIACLQEAHWCQLKDELIAFLKYMMHPLRKLDSESRTAYLSEFSQLRHYGEYRELEGVIRERIEKRLVSAHTHLLLAIVSHYGSIEIDNGWPEVRDITLLTSTVQSITTCYSDGRSVTNTAFDDITTLVSCSLQGWGRTSTMRGLRVYDIDHFHCFGGKNEESRCTHDVKYVPEFIMDWVEYRVNANNLWPPELQQIHAAAIAGFFCPLPKDVFRIVIGY